MNSEKMVQHWREYLDLDKTVPWRLIKVKATGCAFRTDGSHLAAATMRLQDCVHLAWDYWEGVGSESDEDEILFTGLLEPIEIVEEQLK